MLFMTFAESGDFTARVLCDHCGAGIELARQGNLLWQSPGDFGQPKLLFTLHKSCTAAFERQRPGVAYCSDELARLPALLDETLGGAQLAELMLPCRDLMGGG